MRTVNLLATQERGLIMRHSLEQLEKAMIHRTAVQDKILARIANEVIPSLDENLKMITSLKQGLRAAKSGQQKDVTKLALGWKKYEMVKLYTYANFVKFWTNAEMHSDAELVTNWNKALGKFGKNDVKMDLDVSEELTSS